jgi:hypothetical protein
MKERIVLNGRFCVLMVGLALMPLLAACNSTQQQAQAEHPTQEHPTQEHPTNKPAAKP